MDRSWKRVLDPRTRVETVSVMTVGYALWQPTAQLLLHAVWGDPLPFYTGREWGEFIVVCAALGAVAGLVVFAGQRRPPESYRGAWLKSAATMNAFGILVTAKDFTRLDLVSWLVPILCVAVVMGTLTMPFQRRSDVWMARRSGHPG